MNYYLAVLRKYAVFEGRATRSEYWYFMLFNLLFMYSPIIISSILGIEGDGSIWFAALTGFYALAVFIPHMAVIVRRLHDTNHSGWWVFITLVPVVGLIVMIIFLVIDSDPVENQYGKNPKDIVAV